MVFSPYQGIEIFHLLFLKHLGEKLDRRLYALKGGCNLRFYLKSIRYSEDIDLDIATVAKETLRGKVRKILEAPSFLQTLQARGLKIAHLSEPKQTDSVQRWKLALSFGETTVPTKIEFSRRKGGGPARFEPVDPELIASYRLYPILITHYTKEAAFCQKLEALAGRQETQARDVFDLKLLIDAGAGPFPEYSLKVETVRQAVANTALLDYAVFKGQVAAFLAPEYQDYFGSEKAWEETLRRVSDRLASLIPI